MTSVEDSFTELCLKKGEILTFFVSSLLWETWTIANLKYSTTRNQTLKQSAAV